MTHKGFIWRQLTRSKGQTSLFILCVALSISVITAVNGFKDSVEGIFLKDARSLHAADVIVHAHVPLSNPLLQTISSLSEQGRIRAAKVYEFYSVVRTVDNRHSLLSKLKIAAPGYPFYGEVELGSGRSFSQVLKAGKVIADPLLLERLNLKVGDRLTVGDIQLTIADTVLHEPDRPLNVFSLGPRLFVHTEDLAALNLLGKGSRSDYNYLIKLKNPAELNRITDEIRAAANPITERVDTFQTARSGVKRAMDNFLFFLNLTAIFCLILAGFGIQSTLFAFIKDKKSTIAIVKTLGASNHFILLNYSLAIAFLGILGTAAGILAGLGMQRLLPQLLTGLLPTELGLTISIPGLLQSIFLGGMGVLIFTFLPLSRLRTVRPTAIFRNDPLAPFPKLTEIGVVFIGLIFFAVMVLWYLNDKKTGLYFLLSATGLIVFAFLITHILLIILRRLRPSKLYLRQAIRGLFRPGNATGLTVITLSVSLAVILTLLLLEQNINANYVKSYPSEAPNLFFLDIQPHQLTAFKEDLQKSAQFHPVIRARITAINTTPIDYRVQQREKGDNLGREFNLTYRDELLLDEELITGRSLFRSDWTGPQVSVMDTVLKMHPMKIGDRIEFNIQGVPITARISSIRRRTQGNLSPFFYFVFPPDVLKKAPQTIFTALSIPKEKMATLQNKMVTKFPNISVIDVSAVIEKFSRILHQLARVVRFFTFFSTASGLLIFISALLATRSARIREAVYFKILGAQKTFVLRVLTWENIILGLMSAGLAILIAQVTSFIICHYLLDVEYHLHMGTTSIATGLILGAILIIGHIAARPVLAHRPVEFLRENNIE